MKIVIRLLTLALGLAALPAGAADAPKLTAAQQDFFEKKIRPILADNCYECHSKASGKSRGGLFMDTRDALLKGGDTGPGLIAGDPDKSLIIKAVRYTDKDLQMPPKNKKLSSAQIADLEAWVKMGAPDPRDGKALAAAAGPSMRDVAQKHWAFRPVKKPVEPSVKDKSWVQTPVDSFILAKLEEKGMTPSAPTDKRALLRRATYDLTGLPPTMAEYEAFMADNSPDAYKKVVDRLLASPHYGERWGRYWLDLARYSDTKGDVNNNREDKRYPYAWSYRDYVIKAFNDDKPYDQFVKEQISADLMPASQGPDKTSLAALGFLTVGKRFAGNMNDIIDDRIDALTKTFLGLTASCARCHDHKFDPIPTKDYYALHGILSSSTEPMDGPLLRVPAATADYKDFTNKLDGLEREAKAFRDGIEHNIHTNSVAKISQYLMAWYDYTQPPNSTTNRNIFVAQARKLDNGIYNRMDGFLNGRKNRHDPVWTPWIELSRIPERDFAVKSKTICAKWAANKEKDKPINALVARIMITPPASLKDIADRYARLLQETDRQWQTQLFVAEKSKRPAPDKLAQPEYEALRPIVCAAGAPFNPQGREVDGLISQDLQRKETGYRTKIIDLKLTHMGAPARAMAMEDIKAPRDSRVFIRGNASQPGDVAPRQFFEFLSAPGAKPFDPKSSGRKELAESIAKADNPLTARVMVNRIWMHHFGAGIVRTMQDFGTRADEPSHPELLDWMATTFVEGGWSVKKMHRLIMLSNTYQQSSDDNPRVAQMDPSNDYLWRQNVRRLDFEALRDTMLSIGGKLDLTIGGQPVDLTREPYPTRRTVYGIVDRAALATVFRTFDFADPDLTTGQRYETTVPQQALFLMNNALVIEQARNLVGRSDFKSQKSDEERIKLLYRLIYQREATAAEVKLSGRFLELQASPEMKLSGPAWRYGFGEYDPNAKQVKSFTALPLFNGSYQGSQKLPHVALKWVSLNAAGGHPGPSSKVDAIRRWVAPRDGAIEITGTLKHTGKDGDGVNGYIVSNRNGELGRFTAKTNELPTKAVLTVKRGDTIDFIVDCRANDANDGFEWAPVIKMTKSNGPMLQVGELNQWSAKDDFNRPQTAAVKPLDNWEKYAQVLLLTNEMTFVN